MAAVWLLTSRGRPELAAQVVDSCRKTGMRSPLVLYIDGSAKGYDKCFSYVADYRIQLRGGGLAHSLEWCLSMFPDATSYGWLADDTFPRTRGWDALLEQAAGEWGFAHANDLWLALEAGPEVREGSTLTSGLCWGGELVRAAGSWALPADVVQAGIDLAWSALLPRLFAVTYLPRVVVEHWNWRTGKRPRDETDEWVRDGDAYVERDIERARTWIRLGGPERLALRIRRIMVEKDPAWSALLDMMEVQREQQRWRERVA